MWDPKIARRIWFDTGVYLLPSNEAVTDGLESNGQWTALEGETVAVDRFAATAVFPDRGARAHGKRWWLYCAAAYYT
jgi:hypothetical protein